MGQCTKKFGDALLDSFVVGIELVGYEVKSGPDRVARALEDPKVKRAVDKALNQLLLEMAKTANVDSAANQPRTWGKLLSKEALPAATKHYGTEVKKSTAYKRAKASLDQLHCSYKKTPVGVWVDEHSNLLIIAGVGLAVGGAFAMYQTRAGDVPASAAAWLGKTILNAKKIKALGVLTLGAEKLEFKPSERAISTKVFGKTDEWKGINAKFSAYVSTKEDKLVEVGGGIDVTRPNFIGKASSVWSASAGATRAKDLEGTRTGSLAPHWRLAWAIKTPKLGSSTNDFSLSLLAFVEEKDKVRKVGGKGQLDIQTRVADQDVSIFAAGSASQIGRDVGTRKAVLPPSGCCQATRRCPSASCERSRSSSASSSAGLAMSTSTRGAPSRLSSRLTRATV